MCSLSRDVLVVTSAASLEIERARVESINLHGGKQLAYMIYGSHCSLRRCTEEVRYNLPGSQLPAEYFSGYTP